MKKRYKLLILFFISFCLSIIIYFIFNHHQLLYLHIGDSLNNNMPTYSYIDYLKNDLLTNNYNYTLYNYKTIDDLYWDINNNNKLNYYLKNADIITIMIPSNELYNYNELNVDIINKYLDKADIILKKIKTLNNKHKYLISCYLKEIDYLNNYLKKMTDSYNYHFINCNNYDSNPVILNNHTIINYQAHKKIANFILEEAKKD